MRNSFTIIVFVMIMCNSACELHKTEYEYPDGIEEPENIIESRGCGNIFVYQEIDSSRVLTVKLVGNNLELTKKCQTLELGNGNPDVSVVLEVAGNSPDSVYFFHCDDALPMNVAEPMEYFPTSGKLTYSVSEDDPIYEPIWSNSYYVTIKIENLHIYNLKENKEIIFDEIVFWNVRVGWLPG